MSTAIRRLQLADITAEAFAPFGDLIETPGNVARRDCVARIANDRAQATANLAVVRALAPPPGFVFQEMERHPFSTQAFFPLDATEYLVVVAPDDGAQAPSLEELRGWRVRGTQAISYRTGVWHTPMTVLAGAGLFAVLVFEEGTADDTHFRPVAPFMVVP